MKISELYSKKIERPFEAVVDINKFDAKVVQTEIDEYVFTEEIISGLYQILKGIQYHNVTHNGTWINGYYGSGKSHFLKYLKYCFSHEHQERALARLEQAVNDTDIMTVQKPDKFPSNSDIRDTIEWLKKTEMADIAFNFGDEDNKNEEENKSFVHVFWRMFHKFRGYNRESLAIGHYLEKVIDEAGQLDNFKNRLGELNIDWDDALSSYLSDPDTIFDVAKQFVPTLNVEAIRNRIDNNDLDASVSNFCDVISKFVKNKGENYRLLFFADEASQYIDGRKNVLLQLQQLSATLETKCGDKVWIICTAQQGLEEVVEGCHIDKKSDEFGNIIDRFPVRVPLEEVNSTYITQKRFLEKDGNGVIALDDLYVTNKTAIEGQFSLPVGYATYTSKESFQSYYPFVPYQFELIKKVLKAFRSLEYVETTVKDSERSILRIAYNAANKTAGEELGSVIPFDMLLTALGVLAHNGNVAIQMPREVAKQYSDPVFANRVVNALFMLCHMTENDKNQLPANIETLTTLLITNIDENIKSLRDKVADVIKFFGDNNILKKERPEGANYDVYSFYTEEETEVATKIKTSPSGGDQAIAEMLKPIITRYLGYNSSRYTFGATNVNVGMTIFDLFAQGGNYDLMINMKFYSDTDDVAHVALSNVPKTLIFFLAPSWKKDKELQNDINWCCRFNSYMRNEPVTSQLREKINADFKLKAQELQAKIRAKIEKMLDSCQIISGSDNITSTITGQKGNGRLKYALEGHFNNVYQYANLVTGLPTTADQLQQKMLRPIQPDEYNATNPLTDAEKEVDRYLCGKTGRYSLADLINRYKIAPYGWREESTIYVVNELVRRHIRAFVYKGGSVKITPQQQANLIVRSKADFEVEEAAEVSQSLINDFIIAWKDIFNVQQVPGGNNSSQIYFDCKDSSNSMLNNAVGTYTATLAEFSQNGYPFTGICNKVIKLLSDWLNADGEKAFLEAVVNRHDEAKAVMDECKAVMGFLHAQKARYDEVRSFIASNETNFQHLDDADQPVIKRLCEIKDDETPYAQDKFPSYLKLYKEVRGKLDKAIKDAKAAIRSEYENAYNQLLSIVNGKNIPQTVLSQIDAKISSASASNDIATLIMHKDTTTFFNEQIARINAYRPATPLADDDEQDDNNNDDGNDNNDDTNTNVPRVTKVVKLMKPQKQILTTEDDVEQYVQLLKNQLLSHINNGEDVVIK